MGNCRDWEELAGGGGMLEAGSQEQSSICRPRVLAASNRECTGIQDPRSSSLGIGIPRISQDPSDLWAIGRSSSVAVGCQDSSGGVWECHPPLADLGASYCGEGVEVCLEEEEGE